MSNLKGQRSPTQTVLHTVFTHLGVGCQLEDQGEGKTRWGGGRGRLRLTSETGAKSEWQQNHLSHLEKHWKCRQLHTELPTVT